MKRLEKKHPLAIRWLPWVNFPVLLVMLWSGLLILWAYDAYPAERFALKVPGRISVHRGGVTRVYADKNADDYPVPDGERRDINLGFRLAEGMNWHFMFAWLFTLNGVVYVLYVWLSDEWRHLLPRRDSFRGAFLVVVAVLGALMVITGLAIYKPTQLSWLFALLGGYQAARMEHFIVTWLMVPFFGEMLQVSGVRARGAGAAGVWVGSTTPTDPASRAPSTTTPSSCCGAFGPARRQAPAGSRLPRPAAPKAPPQRLPFPTTFSSFFLRYCPGSPGPLSVVRCCGNVTHSGHPVLVPFLGMIVVGGQ
jgi:thiosulfate reductase cytochrome b subunit